MNSLLFGSDVGLKYQQQDPLKEQILQNLSHNFLLYSKELKNALLDLHLPFRASAAVSSLCT